MLHGLVIGSSLTKGLLDILSSVMLCMLPNSDYEFGAAIPFSGIQLK